MNKIYIVTMMVGNFNLSRTAAVGWFPDLNRAKKAVEENDCDIHEDYYEYAVIEESESGLYQICHNRFFYKWNGTNKKFEPVDCPKELESIVNFWE